jgi:hypothetical protein
MIEGVVTFWTYTPNQIPTSAASDTSDRKALIAMRV